MINIDSRGCGAGKSREIRARINGKTIIVVPSIKLIEEYKEALPNARVITSDDSKNVQADLHAAFNIDTQLIIITHKAFLDSNILSGTRQSYNLVIDEAFDPWRSKLYNQESVDINFDWNNIINSTPDLDIPDWNAINFKDDIRTNDICNSSNFVRDIYHQNWNNIIKTDQYESWISDGTKRVEFVQELCPSILAGWRGVWIAAARFEVTFMYWWLVKHTLNFKITKPFERHTTVVTVHYPDDGHGGTTWSKYKHKNTPEIKEIFHDYIKNVTDVKIRLKNNYDVSHMDNIAVIRHNAAGINGMAGLKHVVMESSLNPSPLLGEWLKLTYQTYLGIEKADQALFEARTGYIFYQVGMRCCLRNNEPAHFYVIDNRAVVSIAGYFDAPITKEIHYKSNKGPAPLTGAEKQRAIRAKKKNPEKYAGMNTREILEDLPS